MPQKLVEGIAAFNTIERRRHTDARANEHRRSSETLRVALHDPTCSDKALQYSSGSGTRAGRRRLDGDGQ